MELSERLRELRKARGLAQEALARRTDVSLNLIGKLETSVIKDPHYSTLRTIAKGLDMSVSELLNFED